MEHLLALPQAWGITTNTSALISGLGDELQCDGAPNFSFVLNWGLAAMQIPFCYLPQWLKMWKVNTHIGVSLPNTICFALVTYLQLLTYMCKQFHETFGCCAAAYDGWQCGYELAPFVQTLSGWLGCLYCVVIYFQVFDRQGLVAKNYDPKIEWSACTRQAWVCFLVHVVLTVVPVVLGLAGGAVDAPAVLGYGTFTSVAGSALISCHWVLQMYETWRMQSIGSLSLFMCAFSVLGSAISTFTFWQHGGIVVALPFIAGTISISIAMIFAIWVDRRAKLGLSPDWSEEVPPGPADVVSLVQSWHSSRNSSRRSSFEEESR